MKKTIIALAVVMLAGSASTFAQGGFQMPTPEERVKRVHFKADSAFKLDEAKMKDMDAAYLDYYKAQDKVREEAMASAGGDRDAMRAAMQEKMKPLFKDLTKSKEDFFALIYQKGISDSVLNSYSSKIGEKQMELDISTFHYFQSIKALCNEEQKPKMDSFIKQIVKRIINNGPSRRPPSDKKDNK